MKFQSKIHALGAIAALLVVGGCAGGTAQEPTHRWVSSSASSANAYRADNAACSRETIGEETQRVFDPASPEYRSYVACMESRGYALTSFGNEAVTRR
jgi:hypothetical protein